ncbi:MAG: hypothetical protein HOD63_01355 [Bacteroidetes bacterium]|jgi:hypothetical protein|nr:hypothetical protein [Bacteroidota bacterium]MBT5529750.1 hypothetical protein [Cytophagia bacterium]MBT3422940.1 hypothetical protein [Bacteroidota bacterium]MBT3800108.1 hypothetical protein [Bacteroidota bacterium]MBT3932838.1 hypothetical protein [Bacteroidota bacterium]
MPLHSFQTSVITTSSGVIGGVTKAINSGFTLCSISIPHIIDVAFYAALSAFIGYSIKLGFDELRGFIKRKRSKS